MNGIYIETSTYIVGAVVSLTTLLVVLVILLCSVKHIGTRLFVSTLRIFNITKLTYWLKRMEKEGLTAPQRGYREMVAARKPKTFGDYEAIEQETVFKEAK